jgi:hypothetical protein
MRTSAADLDPAIAEEYLSRNGHTLPHAPAELTSTKLRRLGEGIGKVVYASEHWVVKRERSPASMIALILLWKVLRKLERVLPHAIGARLVQRPAGQLRWIRMVIEAFVLVIPRGWWFMTHIGEVWSLYSWRDVRGETLAEQRLRETQLIPRKITFPSTRVRVSGWPGYLTVSEATERVEATLDQRLAALSREERFEEVEVWLDRLLETRQCGWQHGLFSVDAHLKNFGVTGDRVVLLDTGGLTDSWRDIEQRLSFEQRVEEPHVQLGLADILAPRPDIADRFNTRWKEIVTHHGVRRHWPGESSRPAEGL